MFYERLLLLMKKNKVTKTKLIADIHIGKNQFKYWESNGNTPNGETLRKIAEYFNVTVDYLLGKEENKPSNAVQMSHNNVFMLPLYESVSAGFGVNANDYIVGYVPMYLKNTSEADEYLCITVSGDSMYPKIENGDIIHVKKQSSVDSGQIAVVMLDNENFLVKKVKYGNDYIDLISINPEYKSMHFEGKEVQRLSILGCVQQVTKHI